MDRFVRTVWDSTRSPGLAETATDRLGDFIAEARSAVTRIRGVGDEVSAEARRAYETSASLLEAKMAEAAYLNDLIAGLSVHRATDKRISDSYVSCVLVTDELRSEWETALDGATASYLAGIERISDAEETFPELSSKLVVAAGELADLIEEAAGLKQRSTPAFDPLGTDDHGDSAADATPAEVPCSVTGFIGHSGDVDYFSFPAQANAVYVATVSGGAQSEFLAVMFNSRGQQVYSQSGGGVYLVSASETVFVAVQNYRGGTGAYSLSISAPVDDHPNTAAGADVLLPSSPVDGAIDYVGDTDEDDGETYIVTLSGAAAGEFRAAFSDPSGRGLSYQQNGNSYVVAASEGLHVSVTNYRGSTGAYSLSIAVPTDDHGNGASGATAVELPFSIEGTIDYLGDQDYFSFTAEAGSVYIAEITGSASFEYNVSFMNSRDQQISGYGRPSFTAPASEVLNVRVVNQRNDTGPYSLSVAVPSDDHGNAVSTATAAGIPLSTEGTIEYLGDIDYFSFQAEAGTVYLAETTGGMPAISAW